MSALEFNLEADTACDGRNGGYQGVVHFMLGRQAKRVQAPIPANTLMMASEPGALVRLAQLAASDKLGGEVLDNQLIAVSVVRMCMRSSHAVGERTLANTARAERVAAIAIAKSHFVEELAPFNRTERQISAYGISHARRLTPGTTAINPLIHLPITPKEADEYHVVAAIPALAGGTGKPKPYVALHYSADSVLEQIVLPEDL